VSPILHVRSIRSTPVSVPMARPLGTSAQTIRHAPLLLIDLDTTEGVTGRAYLFCYLPAVPAAVARILDAAFEVIADDRVAPLEIGATLARHFRLIGVRGIVAMALAGIDVACWDALAIAAGVPLAVFLGSAPKSIRAYNSNGLGLIEASAAADEAEELLASGFDAIKMRLGRPTLEADLAAIRAVRRRVPDEIKIMADFNQALTLAEARRRCRAIDGEGLYWIEEPIRHDDYSGCAELVRELNTPIQIGENFAGPQAMAAAIAARAADFIPEASAHVLAATSTAHWLEFVDWAAPILAAPLQIVDGCGRIGDTPGTGVVWNDEAVARYRLT